MILYVNGDSHTAGAEAVNQHTFAEDDNQYFYLGRAPHPDNLSVSWGKLLSLTLHTGFHCDAEGASSNSRILRTTREWIATGPSQEEILIIIQWSTWEREEWEYNGITYQVNGSGIDHIPPEAAERYRNYIIGINWKQKTQEAHDQIWNFHKELDALKIKHIFFNGNNDFSQIADQKDWGTSYIGPYDPSQTFDAIMQAGRFQTVAPNSYHYGKDAHSFFHKFILKYIIKNKFIF